MTVLPEESVRMSPSQSALRKKQKGIAYMGCKPDQLNGWVGL